MQYQVHTSSNNDLLSTLFFVYKWSLRGLQYITPTCYKMLQNFKLFFSPLLPILTGALLLLVFLLPKLFGLILLILLEMVLKFVLYAVLLKNHFTMTAPFSLSDSPHWQQESQPLAPNKKSFCPEILKGIK